MGDTSDNPTSAEDVITEALDGTGEGLAAGLEQIPEEQEDLRTGLETAADVAQGAAHVVRAVGSAGALDEAVRAGDEGRVASSIGGLLGGIGGAAGGLTDALVAAVPEHARGAVQNAANVMRGVAGAARQTERVVDAVEQTIRAIEGRHVVFQTGADLHGARLVGESARGAQRLSGVYEFTVTAVTEEEGGLSDEVIDAILSRSARLGLTRRGDANIYGVVRRIEMLSVHAPAPTHYEITLVPKLWRLSLTRRTRVFQDMTHVQVVLEVLRQHGFDPGVHVSDHTEESYDPHEYVVQYRETDLDFVRRLLAHNGVHFHFVQDAGTEVLILGDRNAAFEPVEGTDELVYHPHDFAPDDDSAHVWQLRRVRLPRSRDVVVRDYNWRAPGHPLRAEHRVDDRSGYGFDDLYGEHVRTEAQARRIAQVRAEEQLVERETFYGRTSKRGLHPGAVFELTNHPHDALNQRYLVLETAEAIVDGHRYANDFQAIPYSVTYRPPREVPWPRVDGVVPALVDGERQSTAAAMDEQGRYRVVLPMDEAAHAGGRASRWVRRAQPSAGAGYGMHFPVHPGTEVAVVHANGDPDRPLIVGAVPNASTESPVIDANGPQGRIRTASGVVFELDDDC